MKAIAVGAAGRVQALILERGVASIARGVRGRVICFSVAPAASSLVSSLAADRRPGSSENGLAHEINSVSQ
jgi:hypothetical protein